MTGCAYWLCILNTLLSGVHASLFVHNESMAWDAAGRSCVQGNSVLLNSIDEHLILQLSSCIHGKDLTFWTGGYTSNVTLRDWISFRGCFDYNHQSVDILNKSQFHTVSTCHQFCGTHMFGLTINTCVCLRDNVLSQHPALQNHYKCIQSGEDVMGIKETIAIYKPVDKMRFISQQDPNAWCSAYECIGLRQRHYKYFAMKCDSTTYYKCDEEEPSQHRVTWNEAASACLNKRCYLQSPILNSSCGPHANIRYWSYVRRFREHMYVTRDTEWGSYIEECEIAHLNGGSITLERIGNCKYKQLPYICQLDDDRNNIYIDSEQCNFKSYTTEVFYSSQSNSPMQTTQSSSTTSGPNKRETTVYLATTRTHNGQNKNILDTSTQFASKGMDTTGTNDYETRATHSGQEIVHTTNQFTQDSSTHTVRNMKAHDKDSLVGLIGGVAAACIVAVVAVVVISIFCSRRSRKNKHREKNNVTSTKERYHSWPDNKQSVEQGEINMNEESLSDVELYDMSGEGEYDHLRSNNRKIKKEAEAMYDTTAQVKAEEEMYSSTRQGNNYVESSDFYDSMQRIQNEDENIYDHSITDSTYSQTAAPRFAMAEY